MEGTEVAAPLVDFVHTGIGLVLWMVQTYDTMFPSTNPKAPSAVYQQL